MKRIGLFYGSNTGNTKKIAQDITNLLKEQGFEVDLYDIADVDVSKINEYKNIIIGASTWGEGDLPDAWEDKLSDLSELNLSGKKIAFFGLGDQEDYSDTFVDAMGILADIAIKNGATIVGDNWSTDGYDFDESMALKDGAFVGLVIDEDNQDELTAQRVKKWIDIIKNSFD